MIPTREGFGFGLDPVVTTRAQLAAASQHAEQDFIATEHQQRQQQQRERNQSRLRESIDSILSPYVGTLSDIAVVAEVGRIARLPRSRFRQRTGLDDGIYTEKGVRWAEDGKPYPFEITYRTEGRGKVGEEGGRIVTPISYTQLLASRTDFPSRELRGNDIRIELKDGKIDEVSVFVSRGMWQRKGTDLLASVEAEDVNKVLDTAFVAPKEHGEFVIEDAHEVSLIFSSLQGQQDGDKYDPKLLIRHHVDYGWKPKNFEYRFDSLENRFRPWHYDVWKRGNTYEPAQFTSLLQSTLSVMPSA